jgi:hypothetical protein
MVRQDPDHADYPCNGDVYTVHRTREEAETEAQTWTPGHVVVEFWPFGGLASERAVS